MTNCESPMLSTPASREHLGSMKYAAPIPRGEPHTSFLLLSVKRRGKKLAQHIFQVETGVQTLEGLLVFGREFPGDFFGNLWPEFSQDAVHNIGDGLRFGTGRRKRFFRSLLCPRGHSHRCGIR
jgi:hypothetical protein